jgi:hypothetical protein
VYKILKDAASDIHDLDNLGDPDKDVAISCSSRFVARLYDQKSFASSHHNINILRVKLATGRDASRVRLTHTKHTYMWVKSKNTTTCMQQNASAEYKSATNKAKQLYKAF